MEIGKNQSTDAEREALVASQHMWRRLTEIERKFQNLQQTVPPHADDWWRRTYAGWRPEVERVKGMLSGTQASPEPIGEREREVACDVLDELELKLAAAEQELGRRTAAGRAKLV
jgi:hypothetical protein